jgi:hypothetical protein
MKRDFIIQKVNDNQDAMLDVNSIDLRSCI